ncbi:MAG TPA: DUF983 domain-containing protein [Candidatus Limnocylindria bacterium]|nr:DUF983 domain-containing protein [Candidatus Limnocylindria bacterium]
MARLRAIVALRCPRCLRGAIWRTFLGMHERCPECGLVFEREPGYFTGAMVVSYAIAVPTFGLMVIALLVAGLDAPPALLTGGIAYLALAPFILRYSRVLWLHFDWRIDPDTGGEAQR